MGIVVADLRKINVALTADQLTDLQAAVDSGAYPSTDAIGQEAITAWRFGHALHDDEVQRLRELWDAGKAGGAARCFEIRRWRRRRRLRPHERAKRKGLRDDWPMER